MVENGALMRGSRTNCLEIPNPCMAVTIDKGDPVVVPAPEVAAPVAVRSAFTANPKDANLYDRAGFPAAPFRTDAW